MKILKKITSAFLVATITLSMSSNIFAEELSTNVPNVSSGVTDVEFESDSNNSSDSTVTDNKSNGVGQEHQDIIENEKPTEDAGNTNNINNDIIENVAPEGKPNNNVVDNEILSDGTENVENNESIVNPHGLEGLTGLEIPTITDQEITQVGVGKKVPVLVKTEPAKFSVSVPSSLPVIITSHGDVITSNEAKITNNGVAPVSIKDVTITGNGSWKLMDYDTFNPAKEKINSKKVALRINDLKTLGEGTTNFTEDMFKTLSGSKVGDDSNVLDIDYDLISQVFSDGIYSTVANVVFILDWTGNLNVGVGSYHLALPSVYAQNGVGNKVSVGESITLSNSSITDGGIWESTEPDVISVDSNTGEITVLKEGVSTISYTDDSGKGEITLEAKDYTMFYNFKLQSQGDFLSSRRNLQGVNKLDVMDDAFMSLYLTEDFMHHIQWGRDSEYYGWKDRDPFPYFPVVYNGKVVTSIDGFYNRGLISYLDLTAWDMSRIESISFEEVRELETLVTTGWDTSSFIMLPSFSNVHQDLNVIGLTDWDLSNVKVFSSLEQHPIPILGFYLDNIDFSNIQVLALPFMFYADVYYQYKVYLGQLDLNSINRGEKLPLVDLGDFLKLINFSLDSVEVSYGLFGYTFPYALWSGGDYSEGELETEIKKFKMDISAYDFTGISDPQMFYETFASFLVKDEANRAYLQSAFDNCDPDYRGWVNIAIK